jgi:hypothetical protein
VIAEPQLAQEFFRVHQILIPSLGCGWSALGGRDPIFLFHHRVGFDAKPPTGSCLTATGAHLALAARNRLGGVHRAAFWRSLGFPNLVKAREVSAQNRGARKQARIFEEARLRNPFALEKTPRGY